MIVIAWPWLSWIIGIISYGLSIMDLLVRPLRRSISDIMDLLLTNQIVLFGIF